MQLADISVFLPHFAYGEMNTLGLLLPFGVFPADRLVTLKFVHTLAQSAYDQQVVRAKIAAPGRG